MKKIMLAMASIVFAASAFAAPSSSEGELILRDSKTSEMRVVTEADTESAKMMRSYLAPAEGAENIYDAYVSNGYLPLHAMMLTNWDVSEALHLVSPGIPENNDLKMKIQVLRSQYTPK